MMKSKVTKNGTVTLPIEIRRFLGIKTGDEIGFVEQEGEFHIVPIKKMEELIDENEKDKAKAIIEDMRRERAREE